MNLFDPVPFFRLLVAYILGVLVVYTFGFREHEIILGALFLGLFTVFLIFRKTFFSRNIILPIVFVLGAFATDCFIQSKPVFRSDVECFLIHVSEDSRSSANSESSIGEIVKIKTAGEWLDTCGKIVIRSQSGEILHKGDQLLVRRIDEIPKNTNIGAFDFSSYYAIKNVYYQVFINDLKVSLIHKGSSTATIRSSLITYVDKVFSVSSSAFYKALLLGDKSSLDSDEKTSYQHTGIMHVLAVSGFHVGIIYKLIDFLLMFLVRSKPKNWLLIKNVMIVLVIWSYAVLVGMTPSVVRASIMLSVFLMGYVVRKKVNNLNLLSFAALLILCFRPLSLFDVGFQLSFLAVLSIFYVYPLLINQFEFKSKFSAFIIQVLILSLSVQVCTFPLTSYYFGYFPTYFLLSNLFVAVSVIVLFIGGLFALLVSSIPYIGEISVQLIEVAVQYFKEFILWLSNLPYATWDSIHMSLLQVFMLLIFITLFCLSIIWRSKKLVFLALCIIGGFTFTVFLDYRNWNRKEELIVFDARQESCFAYYKQRSLFLNDHWSDKADKYILSPFLREYKVYKLNYLDKSTFASVFEINGMTVLHLKKKPSRMLEKVDVVIISNNCIDNISDFKNLNASYFVFDSSNSYKLCKKLNTEIEELAIHFVPLTGIFVLNQHHGKRI